MEICLQVRKRIRKERISQAKHDLRTLTNVTHLCNGGSKGHAKRKSEILETLITTANARHPQASVSIPQTHPYPLCPLMEEEAEEEDASSLSVLLVL
ncbi:hypothetical protein BHE74_00051836 [Ensete ventricosum]|nr:hypothetical protein BHE74_00051836 [Ensete ventricosum]